MHPSRRVMFGDARLSIRAPHKGRYSIRRESAAAAELAEINRWLSSIAWTRLRRYFCKPILRVAVSDQLCLAEVRMERGQQGLDRKVVDFQSKAVSDDATEAGNRVLVVVLMITTRA